MAECKIYLFVDIDVKAGKIDEFWRLLENHAKVIRTEQGCEHLSIFVDLNDPNKLCVWEIWTTRADWDAHMANENSQQWRPVAADYVNGETIKVMNEA